MNVCHTKKPQEIGKKETHITGVAVEMRPAIIFYFVFHHKTQIVLNKCKIENIVDGADKILLF